MSKELSIITQTSVAMTLSSPELRRLQKVSLGTVQMTTGSPVRKYLSAGQTLTDEDRAIGAAELTKLERLMDPYGRSSQESKVAVIAKLLLAYPAAGSTEASGQARAEAYFVALDDIPAWAISAAVTKWHRGECGDQNYSWAPAPAVLRSAAERALEPVKDAIRKVSDVLNAKPLDETMAGSDSAAASIVARMLPKAFP